MVEPAQFAKEAPWARALAALVAAADPVRGDGPPWPAWANERPVSPELLRYPADTVAVERRLRELVPDHTPWDEEGWKQSRLETTQALSGLSAELSRAVSAQP